MLQIDVKVNSIPSLKSCVACIHIKKEEREAYYTSSQEQADTRYTVCSDWPGMLIQPIGHPRNYSTFLSRELLCGCPFIGMEFGRSAYYGLRRLWIGLENGKSRARIPELGEYFWKADSQVTRSLARILICVCPIQRKPNLNIAGLKHRLIDYRFESLGKENRVPSF